MQINMEANESARNVSFVEEEGQTKLHLKDLECVRAQDMYAFNLNGTTRSMVEQYDKLRNWVRDISTIGGTIIGGRNCTFRDAINPIFILKVEGEYKGKNVTTSFLIGKEDLYVVGFNVKSTDEELKNPSNWFITPDGYTILKGANYTKWSCSYQVQRNNFAKNDTLLLGKLGRVSILHAMYILHHESLDYAKCAAFHCIARNFCEAFRFTNVANTVKSGISQRKGEPLEKEGGYDLSLYFKNWSTLCKILSNFSREGYLDSDEWDILDGLKIETTDQLKRIMFIIKRENPKSREKRRRIDQVKYNTLEHAIRATNIKVVTVHSSWKAIKLVDNSVQKKRMQYLFNNWKDDVAASEEQLKQMRANEFQLLKKAGRKDIWDSFEKAFAKLEGNMKRYFKSIIDDTDIILLSKYLDKWCDDRNITYKMDELILCRPHPA